MTEHYHALPLTPNWLLHAVAGGNSWLVSYGTNAKAQAHIVEENGERVAYDNGAFSRWMKLLKDIEKRRARGEAVPESEIQEFLHGPVDWTGYYRWLESRLDRPTSWAIVPDKIDASSQEQDGLINQWPYPRSRSAPVWHLHHHVDRLKRLMEQGWNRVCIGSAGEFREVMTPMWIQRMALVFNELERSFGSTLPALHLLRGLAVITNPDGCPYPVFSGDSSNAGQNHHRLGPNETVDPEEAGELLLTAEGAGDGRDAKIAAVRKKLIVINSAQAAARWIPRAVQTDIEELAA